MCPSQNMKLHENRHATSVSDGMHNDRHEYSKSHLHATLILVLSAHLISDACPCMVCLDLCVTAQSTCI